jgi:regulator of sigma E protease
MELASFLTIPFWTVVTYVVPFLVVLSVIVFFHELGHFKVARWCGVGIDAFAVGFGKEVFGWTDKHGTRWKFGWIPLGGYVKFQDDSNATSLPADEENLEERNLDPAKSFHRKTVSQRAAVVAAGPIANFLLAIFIFAASYMFVGYPIASAIIDEIKPGSAAEQAGLLPGDHIIKIDDTEITTFSDMQRIVSVNAEQRLQIELMRDGRKMKVEATPTFTEIDDQLGGTIKQGLLGVRRDVSKDMEFVKQGPIDAVSMATAETWYVIKRSLILVKGLIIGREDVKQLTGPIGIARISGKVASVSLNSLIQLAAYLSVSIGLINLFPIPMLDGGHLLYYLVEAVRGKPLGQGAQEFGFKVGLALVGMLMVVATWNDIVRLISSLSGS